MVVQITYIGGEICTHEIIKCIVKEISKRIVKDDDVTTTKLASAKTRPTPANRYAAASAPGPHKFGFAPHDVWSNQ